MKPAYLSLAPGDPWTMIRDEPIYHLGSDMRITVKVGDTINKWFATNEPGRLFRVTAIHGCTYETVYLGFEPCPTPTA